MEFPFKGLRFLIIRVQKSAMAFLLSLFPLEKRFR